MTTEGFPDWNINGLIPIGNGVADDFGSLWWIDGELAGWDSPDMRTTMLPRIGTGPSSDGEFAGDLHYRGRSITFTIYCAATSEENRENSRLLLARALDLTAGNGELGIFYANEVVPKQCYIQRAGNTNQGKLTMANQGLSQLTASTPGFISTELETGGQVYLFRADVEMYAADPRKYAQSTTTVDFDAGTAEVTPLGNTANQKMLLHCTYAESPGDGPLTLTYNDMVQRLLVPIIPSGGPTLNPIPAEFYVDIYSKLIYDADLVNYFYLMDLQTPWLIMPPATLPSPLEGAFVIDPAPDTATLVYSDAWI
jgi:hypothetical protein